MESEKEDVYRPPHERGWTASLFAPAMSSVQTPARAGMDLRRACPSRTMLPDPRTSGDGPQMAFQREVMQNRPPHERGWTSRTEYK